MKRKIAEEPFKDYYLYGPYFHQKQGRYYVNLIPIDNELNRTSMSLSRYKMSVYLKRILDLDEEVDHMDEDKSNDSIDNLQILTPQENHLKTHGSVSLADVICAECGKVFSIKPKILRDRAKRRKYPPCCSRSCSAKYQRAIENQECI
jgi:hypothetical protein